MKAQPRPRRKQASKQTTWIFDAPSGTYRNPVMSALVREAADEKTVIAPHIRYHAGFAARPHDSITLTTFEPPVAEPLNEVGRTPGDIELHPVTIKVSEFGSAVPFTSLTDELTVFDPETSFVQARLVDMMALTEDAVGAVALKASPVKVVLGAQESPFTDERYDRWFLNEELTERAWRGVRAFIARKLGIENKRGIKAAKKVDVASLRSIVNQLHDVYRAPTVDGSYLLFASHGAIRELLRLWEFEHWTRYSTVETRFRGEVGRIPVHRTLPDIRVIQVRGNVLTGDDFVIAGDEALAGVVATEPHLRVAIASDFGRHKAVAVYGIYGVGLVWQGTTPGLCRSIHVTEGPTLPTFREALRSNLQSRWSGFKGRQRERANTWIRTPIATALYALADLVARTTHDEDDD